MGYPRDMGVSILLWGQGCSISSESAALCCHSRDLGKVTAVPVLSGGTGGERGPGTTWSLLWVEAFWGPLCPHGGRDRARSVPRAALGVSLADSSSFPPHFSPASLGPSMGKLRQQAERRTDAQRQTQARGSPCPHSAGSTGTPPGPSPCQPLGLFLIQDHQNPMPVPQVTSPVKHHFPSLLSAVAPWNHFP